MRDTNKRPRRNPLSSEEVSNIIAHKKRKELIRLYRLKKSKFYLFFNIFNVLCIFLYLELLFCYFGPCTYEMHTSSKIRPHYYGEGKAVNNNLFISDIDVYDQNGKSYKFLIGAAIPTPSQNLSFLVAKDFILRKPLKGVLQSSGESYRLFSASPILFLCVLATFISFFGFIMNLNENEFTLVGISLLNFLVLIGVVLI